MGVPRLLVCDIDGTLLRKGSPTPGLRALRLRIRQERSRLRLVYATGRSFASTWSLVETGTLPAPDAVAAQVGTELWLPPFHGPHRPYERELSGAWDLRGVTAAADRCPELQRQASWFQTPYKASYLVAGDQAKVVRRLRARIAARGLEAKLLYSGQQYLDILPARAGKLGAVAHLCSHWGDHPAILACGDSGNDLDLLSDPRVQGVVVSNASDGQLTSLTTRPDVYRARMPFAAGVLDGARHYRFFRPPLDLRRPGSQQVEATA